MKFKLFLQWLSKRSALFFSFFLFGIGVIFIWFLTIGQPRSIEQVALGIAVLSAFFASVSAIASLLQAVEVQRQREAQERPYIIAYFDSTNNGALYFVIENAGNSPANNIKFNFRVAPTDFAGRTLDKISLFAKPISFLPAGKSLRQIVNASYRFFEEGNPTNFSFEVSYKSIFGEIFQEKFEHDLEYLRQATLPAKTTNDYLKNVSDELNKIRRGIEKMKKSDSKSVSTSLKRAKAKNETKKENK